jgi:hypothetical protein
VCHNLKLLGDYTYLGTLLTLKRTTPAISIIPEIKNDIETPESTIEYFTALLYSIFKGLFKYTKNVIKNIINPQIVNKVASGLIIGILFLQANVKRNL